MLESRVASSKKHLSDVIALADEWDTEVEKGGDASFSMSNDELWPSRAAGSEDRAIVAGELQELRPLLVVDKAELEQDLARLDRQIAMLKR